jgi:uncharacterized protein YuzE
VGLDQRGILMKIKHFEDTDTAIFEFTDHEVKETKEVGENIFIDLDDKGNIVNITIEHANRNANIQEFSFKRIYKESA